MNSMIAEEQRNRGGGGGTQQVESQDDGGGQSSPVVDTTLSGGSEPESSTSSAPTHQQVVAANPQVVAPSAPPAHMVLGPLLQPNVVPMLQQAVRSGQARLNAELHRFYGTQRQVSSAAMGMREFHFALPLLVGLAERIGRDASLKMEVKRLGMGGRPSPRLHKIVSEIAVDSFANNQNFQATSLAHTSTSNQSGQPLDGELVNIALFPPKHSFYGVKTDDVLTNAYDGLILRNVEKKNKWLILHVKDIDSAHDTLVKYNIKNLVIFSHGQYERAQFDIGNQTVVNGTDVLALRGVRAQNIIIFACFAASDLVINPGGRMALSRLANITGANVFGNMGYSYPDKELMWNEPGNLKYVIAGVDQTWVSTREKDYRYINGGAGRWVIFDPNSGASEIPPVFLNYDGSFGYLGESWRDYFPVKSMLESCEPGYPFPGEYYPTQKAKDELRSIIWQTGKGGELIPRNKPVITIP
jgi:hypothetical protein